MRTELERYLGDTKSLGSRLDAEQALERSSSTPSIATKSRRMPGDGLISDLDGSDPREGLSLGQRQLVRRLARGGESLDEAATRVGMHPERARRAVKTPRMRRAILLQRARPMTDAQMRGDWSREDESNAE